MLAYSLSALIAFIAAMGELVARYQDAPRKAVFTVPGFFYLTVNVLAAILAYFLMVKVFVLDFGLTDAESLKRDSYRVLLASLGSMAFFRSSLFNMRVGNAAQVNCIISAMRSSFSTASGWISAPVISAAS